MVLAKVRIDPSANHEYNSVVNQCLSVFSYNQTYMYKGKYPKTMRLKPLPR